MSSKIWTKLSDITKLSHPNVRIKNPENVEKIINEIRVGGFDNLQIVTDFDYTVTKKHLPNGESVPSSFCILEKCKSFPESNKELSRQTTAKYKPIELDPTISISDKIPHMVEWWTATSEILRYIIYSNIY